MDMSHYKNFTSVKLRNYKTRFMNEDQNILFYWKRGSKVHLNIKKIKPEIYKENKF